MNSRSIRTFKFNHNGLEEVKNQPLGTDWPVVYLLTNSSEIYIGETSNARARMEQHLANPEREKLKEIHILFDDEFKDEYDLGDIDMEGFQDLSFDDGTMF